MKYSGKVKQIAEIRRSTKTGNRHFQQVKISLNEGGNVTLLFSPGEAECELDDLVDIEVGITLKGRQEKLFETEGR